jgi:hypothetical protein
VTHRTLQLGVGVRTFVLEHGQQRADDVAEVGAQPVPGTARAKGEGGRGRRNGWGWGESGRGGRRKKRRRKQEFPRDGFEVLKRFRRRRPNLVHHKRPSKDIQTACVILCILDHSPTTHKHTHSTQAHRHAPNVHSSQQRADAEYTGGAFRRRVVVARVREPREEQRHRRLQREMRPLQLNGRLGAGTVGKVGVAGVAGMARTSLTRH